MAEAIRYLDRALSEYKLSGDVLRCAEVALLVLRELQSLPAERRPNNFPYVFYLDLVDAAGSSVELDAERLLLLARTSAAALSPQAPRAFERAYQLAEQAYAKALDLHDERWAANAKLITGPGLLNQVADFDAGAELDAFVR